MNIVYLIAAILAVALTAAGPALAYFDAVPPLQGFFVFALGLFLGAIVALIGIGVVIKGATPITYAAAALGVPPFLILVVGIVSATRYPPINDIATDVNYPPQFTHAQDLPANEGEDFTFPEKNRELIKEAYPDLSSLAVEGEMEDTVLRISELARQQPGWTVTQSAIKPDESFVEGYAETGIFRFKDDFVIRITDANGGVVVDMRSRSRDGQGDFGANAERIQQFLAKLGG